MNRLSSLLPGFIASLLMSFGLPLWAASGAIETADIVRSPADQRLYRALTLDNGLRVMLVSDAEAERAAAALDVHVGSGHDPQNRQGLAHYLEHMLFLGTQKYPEAGEYQAYIAAHGGSNNAYTSLEHTNFFFSIAPDYFEGALDRFAQFFIAPLFNEQYVSRERAIVDSEFRARKDDEGRRLWTARRELYHPQHPSRKFSVGNVETLADRPEDPVRADLVAFYQRYYHAPRMALAVVGPQSLDQLQAWVATRFSAVSSRGTPYTPFDTPLVAEADLPAQLSLKPKKETRRLTFSFPIPPVYQQVDSKPAHYLSNLLGHEGEGSLLALLKDRTWATGLSAGLGYGDPIQATFDVTIQLSEQGMMHIEEIGSLLFAYVQLVREKGIQPLYYRELSQLAELEFRFQEKGSEMGLVQGIAKRLHRYAPEEVLSAPYLISRYAPEEIEALLGKLVPDNLQLVIVDPQLDASRKTPWYGVSFSQAPLNPQWLERWRQPQSMAGLALPAANPFIPEQLDMLPASAQDEGHPRKLDNDHGVELWHQTELEFDQPKAALYFTLRSADAKDSPEATVLTELYVRAVQEALNAYTYSAYLAGLNYRIYPHSRGLSVRINGYSARQSELLETVIDKMLEPALNQAQFELYRESLRRRLENSLKGRPSSVVMDGVYGALLTTSWSVQEKLDALGGVTLEALNAHQRQLLEAPALMMLSLGNVREADSLVAAGIVGRLNAHQSGAPVSRIRVRRLKQGNWLTQASAAVQDDAAIALVYQGQGVQIEELARMQMLGALIATPYYQTLRTEGQVGYIVHAYALNPLDTPALGFSVQSNSHSVEDIVLRTRSFLQGYAATLAQMTEADFIAHRTGLIAKLRQQDKQLSERAGRFWSELDREAYDFDTRERLTSALEALDKAAVVAYFEQLVADDAAAVMLSYSFGKQSSRLDLPSPPSLLSYDSLGALREDLDEYL